MNNSKTTLAGIGTILVAIGIAMKALFDGDPSTNFDIASAVTSVTAGITLIWAKDPEKKSE
jgi:hypothetical protein